METEKEERIADVVSYHFDEKGNYLVYVTANPEPKKKKIRKRKIKKKL
ncbi:hypothetical protein QNH98_16020 [Myroides sp. mNGS23_01]|nr:hypothetical protein [Myroides sp. mNGS23_01]WHT38499.1 hypothetical protein QNH98_16020 [Myroides sp. mNGS23_01]